MRERIHAPQCRAAAAPGKRRRIPDNAGMPSSPRASAPSFTAPAFRAALGMFATGVTIVTARGADGAPVGLTANSFNSVSLAPPLVLWSLARSAGSMPAFERGSHYAINILAADQRALAERFAGKARDRFKGVPFHEGAGRAPILDGACAVFECFNRSRYEEGDHVIFVGEVERCMARPGAQPLIFHGGRYFTELPL
jgi:flavin reductase (DIM6/NTAB) family NADH-FMN oxidoreductase RutF